MHSTPKNNTRKKKHLWQIYDNEKKVNSCYNDSNNNDSTTTPTSSVKNDGQCKNCSFILIISEEGFPTCINPKCGMIYKDVLDYSPEWRFYNGSDNKNNVDTSRCGTPINPLLQESSFGCKITCQPNSSYQLKKIRRYTEWQSMPYHEKSLYNEFQFITIMAQNAGISKIFIDDAIIYHKYLIEQKICRGLNRDGIKAASIYIACRLNNAPRTAQEIATIFHLDKTSASSGCSMAISLLHNIKRNNDSIVASSAIDDKNTAISLPNLQLSISLPSNFIERFCNKLAIQHDLTILSKFIATKIESNNLLPDDNTPQSIAAGIIYFIIKLCKLNIQKNHIRTVCCVSEVTINKCAKKIELIKDKIIPDSILQMYNS